MDWRQLPDGGTSGDYARTGQPWSYRDSRAGVCVQNLETEIGSRDMIIHEDTPRWWKLREKELPREGIFRDHSCTYC
jgi:hypothetical protein